VGFINSVAGPLRKVFATDRNKQNAEIAKGAIYEPNHPGGLMAAFDGNVYSDYLRVDTDLLAKYMDYQGMDDYAELSSALDVYADDATQIDQEQKKILWVSSKDDNAKIVLNDLYHKTLRVDEEAWEVARNCCKYGNDFEEILVAENGVVGLNFLPTQTVRRIEGPHGDVIGFLQDFTGKTGYSPEEFKKLLSERMRKNRGEQATMDQSLVALEDWEVAHFRLRGKNRSSPYGTSVLDSARFIWKRLMLLEDAAMVFRIQRAPERYAFYVDVGDMPPKEAIAHLNQVRAMHKKRKMIDPSTGKLNLRWEAISPEEDIYIPVRKGIQGARVEVLQSPAWQQTDDLEYFLDKMFAAVKVPKAYLGKEGGVAKAVLSSEDVRFARTILRVQNALKSGYKQVGRVHLAALGIDPNETDFDLNMTVPSAIFELAQLEVKNARADYSARMKADVSQYWILSKIHGMTDTEIENIFIQKKEDFDRDSAMQMEQMQAQQQAATAGMPPQPGAPGAPGAPQAAPAAPPGIISGPQALAMANQLAPAQEWRQKKSLRLGRGITEQELFKGNREHEKRAEESFAKLLKSDLQMQHRLTEMQSLLHELRTASRR
jgi:hypothetical protein